MGRWRERQPFLLLVHGRAMPGDRIIRVGFGGAADAVVHQTPSRQWPMAGALWGASWVAHLGFSPTRWGAVWLQPRWAEGVDRFPPNPVLSSKESPRDITPTSAVPYGNRVVVPYGIHVRESDVLLDPLQWGSPDATTRRNIGRPGLEDVFFFWIGSPIHHAPFVGVSLVPSLSKYRASTRLQNGREKK